MNLSRTQAHWGERGDLWAIAGATALFLLIWLAPPLHALQGANVMTLPVHIFVETFSIAVSMLVFGVAWNAYSAERSGNLIILACAFFCVGLIDFAHVLSFKGMPDFVTVAGPEKAINFWLCARLVAALALLAVALRPWTPFARPRSRWGLLALALAVTACTYWLGLWHQDLWPRTFIEGKGLTTTKVAAEWIIIAVLIVPATIFYRKARRTHGFDARGIFVASIITILSELAFSLYSNVNDIFNLLGHVYKFVAYLYIYRAVFVDSVHKPFEQLLQAREDVAAINRDLERRVVERTAQLEMANKDLEGFSYSVSHDLRVPLRAIDGFSRILLEDYAERVDDEGKRLLRVIRDSTNKMAELIDDILAFSRAGRDELALVEVDVAELASDVFDELRQTAGERKLNLVLETAPCAHADRAMLRQVLVNLIANAIKFTRPRAEAVIRIGGKTSGGETVYYVADNGVGFDMQYAGKLYGVFQRLHGPDIFEGTGIGLAIVKRIISKHGGRTWAESALDRGATFYFSLPAGAAGEGGDR